MLVYSFDRKSIIEASVLQVQRNLGGGKEAKFVIIALRDAIGEATVLAQFPDEKTAIDALEKVFQAFADGAKYYKFG